MASRLARAEFELVGVTPAGIPAAGIAVATSRAGGLGILDLSGSGAKDWRAPVRELISHGRVGRVGVRLDVEDVDELSGELPPEIKWRVISSAPPDLLQKAVEALAGSDGFILAEVVDAEEAAAAVAGGADALIARGNEAGGRIGEETAFVLGQSLSTHELPVFLQGGIGVHTVAACQLAGAAGAVLDAQLWLTRESPLEGSMKRLLERADGSETTVVQGTGNRWRIYDRPGLGPVARLREAAEDPLRMRQLVRESAGWRSPEHDLLLLGQDAAFAASLAQHATVGGVIAELRGVLRERPRSAARLRPFAERAPLALEHDTRLPLVQGPMTRVSDVPEFALAVADAGALPFLALALMQPTEVDGLLGAVADQLGDRAWGVGILGFVPLDLREAQLEVVARHRPPFALIAGGRPDQARWLEERGIPTYLHVPSPTLLAGFARDGARRFVLEGRECGGHVGPRSSFVLWSQGVDVLLDALSPAELSECRVLLAGGIHDARSAAMAATVATPLCERGAAVGALMGSAYVLTREAAETGAVVSGFQQEALRCEQTVLLQSGPGHATRCAPTPFAEAFERERLRLADLGVPSAEAHDRLEHLSLGRLRIAAKGRERRGDAVAGGRPPLVDLEAEEQAEQGLYMLGQVAALRSATTTLAALHEDVTTGATRILERSASQAPDRKRKRERPSDAAIVGMACILPGAPNLATFWEKIISGADAITEVPPHRFDWHRFYDPDGAAADAVNSRWGGFIDEVVFDPARWGMPPRSLHSIEPMQLLALEVAGAALADAGYERRPFPRERTSVILGVGGGLSDLGNRYAVRAGLPLVLEGVPAEALDLLPEWTEDSFAGILLNVAAGRVANRLDLGGVNYTVDAACASSLAAVQLATRELEIGTSDMVVVGGADTVQNPFGYLCFSKTHALSPTGRCRPFDDEADGIAISEGLAMVVLKRLADAERDGDRIYSVIKAVGGSSDGRAKALTAPRPEGQLRALRRAYEKAGVSPASVELVEAHGTGTVAGDRAEADTLRTAFDAAGAPRRSCALGSVKSMIGHTKCTAGLAGLVKTSLALHHKVLPPTLNVKAPNRRVNFEESPFYINTEARPWMVAQDRPRLAGVSAFGFGGTNFHCVLEEYRHGYLALDGPRPLRQWPAEIFVLAASSPAELARAARQIADSLSAGAAPPPAELAAALWRAVSADQSTRLAVVAADLDELASKLLTAADALQGDRGDALQEQSGIHYTPRPQGALGTVAFLFPGQGSQHCDMLRELVLAFPFLRERLEWAERELEGALSQPLGRLIFPPPRFSDEERAACEGALRETVAAQPALGAAGLAARDLLVRLGLEPAMVAGHSYGELVALCAAGALGEADLLKLSLARGRAIAAAADRAPGAMAALSIGPERLVQALARREEVVAANLNSPRQSVVSGPVEAIEGILNELREEGISGVRIPVACAFHSPLMAPACERLATALAETRLQGASMPVFSNLTARPHSEDPEQIAEALVEHLVKPVRFADEIEAMYEAGARVFVEVGPRGVLTRLVGETLAERPHAAVALQGANQGLFSLTEALAELVAHRVQLTLEPLWAARTEGASLEDLLKPAAPAALPPTAWLVDGGSARPAREPPSTAAPVPIRGAQGGNGAGGLPSRDSTMARFQGLMETFLTDQRDAMLAWVANGHSSAQPPLVADSELPARLAPMAELVGPPQGHSLIDAGDAVLIAADDRGVAEALATILGQRGARPLLVHSEADPASVVERVRGKLAALVDLRPLGAVIDPAEVAESEAHAHVGDLVIGLMGLAQASAAPLRAARGTVLAATCMGGSFGLPGAVRPAGLDPAHGAICGLVKSIGAEWPEVSAKLVDFPTEQSPTKIAEQIAAELSAHDGHPEVGFSSLGRISVRVKPAPLANARRGAALEDEAVVLVTGGARGITSEVVRHLASRYRPRLVLVGRTPLQEDEPAEWTGLSDSAELRAAMVARLAPRGARPPEIEAQLRAVLAAREVRATLAAVESAGCRVDYRQADAARPEELGAVIEETYARYGRIDGVIHGAGVIEDAALERKSTDSVRRVLDAKVGGALTLARRLQLEKLKFVVFFASIAGRFGNAGQSDYAAANEFLCKLAANLGERTPARVLAVAWGPWAGRGMVSAEIERRFADRGVKAIDPEAACAALFAELECGPSEETEVVIGDGPWLGQAESQELAQTPIVLDPHEGLIADHLLDGHPVLPAAAALELLAEAGASALEAGQTQIEDFRLLRGVVLDGEPMTLLSRTSPDSAPESVQAELVDPASGLANYRARVCRADDLAAAPPPALAPGPPFPLSVEEIYERWLWHGPRLRAIASIDAQGSEGIDATLTAPSPSGGLDPVLIDCVFQLAIVWARHNLEMTSLPARVSRVSGRLLAASAGPISCRLRIALDQSGTLLTGRASLFDAAGGRLNLDGLELTCSRELNRLASEAAAVVAQ